MELKMGNRRSNTPYDFWDRVVITSPNNCWNWTGCILNDGYGQVRMNMKKYRTHRLAYQLTYGSIPDELLVLHTCDNPKCCNPNHLWVGTVQDNSDDMKNKNRQVKGEDMFSSKLTSKDVIEIRRLYATGTVSQRDLGRMYGVYHSTIGRILHGVIWRHIHEIPL